MANDPEFDEADSIPDGWSDEARELDRLYRQALDAVEMIEQQVEQSLEAAEADHEPGTTEFHTPESGTLGTTNAPPPAPPSEGGEPRRTPINQFRDPLPSRPTAKQVLEAALFVGGVPVATKMLAHILQGEFPTEFVENTLDELNRQYADEGRPYEVRLGEGGWELALRPSFEAVRRRVYGLGPKEVKLSQEALEVLSVVAYRQPISADEIVTLGKPSPNAALRQLLRRELVAIERGEGGRKDVKYRTTRRFLQLFDLEALDDLPQPEEIEFK